MRRKEKKMEKEGNKKRERTCKSDTEKKMRIMHASRWHLKADSLVIRDDALEKGREEGRERERERERGDREREEQKR